MIVSRETTLDTHLPVHCQRLEVIEAFVQATSIVLQKPWLPSWLASCTLHRFSDGTSARIIRCVPNLDRKHSRPYLLQLSSLTESLFGAKLGTISTSLGVLIVKCI